MIEAIAHVPFSMPQYYCTPNRNLWGCNCTLIKISDPQIGGGEGTCTIKWKKLWACCTVTLFWYATLHHILKHIPSNKMRLVQSTTKLGTEQHTTDKNELIWPQAFSSRSQWPHLYTRHSTMS